MAITTDSAIHFFGTEDLVSSATGSVVNDAFSNQSDVVNGGWTNDDDAPMATAKLIAKWADPPTANSSVVLCARLMDIDGSNDAPTPDANFTHSFLGMFPINDSSATQNVAIDVSLPNMETSQLYEFYIQNKTKETLDSGWKLYMTPKTIGPHG